MLHRAERKHSAPWILEGDIKSCFDRISHDWLLAHIPMDKAMLRKWLKAGYMERHVLHRPTKARRKAASSPPCWPTWRWTGWNSASAVCSLPPGPINGPKST